MSWACRIVLENCTGCGICVDVCPHGALRMDRAMPYPESLDGACVGCMDCERECPFDAVLMEQAEASSAIPVTAG